MKLRSGMTSQGPDVFRAEDICAIIKVASKNKVSSLSYRGLEVKFESVPNWVATPDPGESDFSAPDSKALPSHVAAANSKQSLVLSEEDKHLMEEARLATLMVEDPLAYEQEMIDANLYGGAVHGQRENA